YLFLLLHMALQRLMDITQVVGQTVGALRVAAVHLFHPPSQTYQLGALLAVALMEVVEDVVDKLVGGCIYAGVAIQAHGSVAVALMELVEDVVDKLVGGRMYRGAGIEGQGIEAGRMGVGHGALRMVDSAYIFIRASRMPAVSD